MQTLRNLNFRRMAFEITILEAKKIPRINMLVTKNGTEIIYTCCVHDLLDLEIYKLYRMINQTKTGYTT